VRDGRRSLIVLTFITGPVRAGKSTLAQRLAEASRRRVIYCATAAWDEDDPEWRSRIERHRAERPAEWQLVETAGPRGADLMQRLREAERPSLILIESLGTWVADVLTRGAQTLGGDIVRLHAAVEAETNRLLDAIEACEAEVIVVSEEVGWSVVPPYPAGRVFRDVMGRANQRLCAVAARAYLLVCGVALDLKQAQAAENLPRPSQAPSPEGFGHP
jgi:adenosylcobinamide kinase/adenosylcobinamide-phosphate guanylyltransferase